MRGGLQTHLARPLPSLQSPTGYTGPYRGWDVSLFFEGAENTPDYSLRDFWDFGTSGQYPALKVDFDGDGTATWREFGNQRGDAPGPAPAPVVDNCVEIMTAAVVSGAWSGNCASGSRPGSYARFYTFTLTEPSEVIIDLESGDTGTYLYLLQGAGRAGEVLEDYGSARRSAQIGHTLGAGTYTVEVTTYDSGQTGSFTLTVNWLATPPTPPPPPGPPATVLPPTPTPTHVPTSTPAPAEPTNVSAPTPSLPPTPMPTRVPTSTPELGGTHRHIRANGDRNRGAGTHPCPGFRRRVQLPGRGHADGRGGYQYVPIGRSAGYDRRVEVPRPATAGAETESGPKGKHSDRLANLCGEFNPT